MKKFSRIMSVLVIAAMLVLAITACENDSKKPGDTVNTQSNTTEAVTEPASKVNGKTYVFESYTLGGEDMTATLTAMYSEQTFTFKDGGVCEQKTVWAGEMAQLMGSEPTVLEGTYVEDGDKVTVTFRAEGEEDAVAEFTVDSDTIKLTEEGGVTVYRLKAEG